MLHYDLQLQEYLERPRGLPKLQRDLGNTKQRFEKEANMAKTLLTPKAAPPAAPSLSATATAASPAADDDEYKDDFFGDDPFATANTDKSGGRTASAGFSGKSMVPTDFRRPGMAPPNLPGPDAELPDYDRTLASEVRFTTAGFQALHLMRLGFCTVFIRSCYLGVK